ncbi:hypothetical protein [Microbacterium sp. No. 7]|uniref:hypothetical protein n=1 Tax=Microbacterium sp. No. 7 TaxID=1714373 RepID=UPI0006D1C763|nr:hypothetical protein [Microbacterium sp. No. 7]ALJ19910.1 hypothetical protein AOA12_08320 [Microbacterium sp. No. 7]
MPSRTGILFRPSPIALLRRDTLPHPERAIARGEAVKVRRGVFAEREAWRALAPWDRYLARVHAVALDHPGAVFCDESAAALLGAAVFGDPHVVHVSVPAGATSRQSGGIRTRVRTETDGILSSAGMTATDAVVTAVTLARHRHPVIGLAVADSILRLDRSLTRDMLRAENEHRASGRGRACARWVIDRATPLAESPLESVSRAVTEWLGFPDPVLQREFVATGGTTDRGDLWWPHLRLLAEADGDVKYDGTHGDPLEALQKRRTRDIRLLAGEVSKIAHFGWTEVTFVDPYRALLLGQGLQTVAPENTAALAGVKRLLAPRRHDT